MPEAFERCVKNGGKVRTKTLPGGWYRRICFIGKRSYAGELKKKKEKKK